MRFVRAKRDLQVGLHGSSVPALSEFYTNMMQIQAMEFIRWTLNPLASQSHPDLYTHPMIEKHLSVFQLQ